MADKTKGLTVKLGFDNSEFKTKMREANKDIKATDQQISALQKSLSLKWDSAKFAQAQKLAQDAIAKTEVKAKQLKEEMARLEAAGVDKASASYVKLQTELIKTGDEALKLKDKLEQVNQIKVDRLANSFKNAGDKISKVGQALLGVSAVASAVIAGLGKIASDTVATAAEIDDMSQSVNLNAVALQKWRYIAMQLGLDSTTLQTSLAKTQAAFADLSMGEVTPATDALAMLGFSAEQAAKGMDVNFEQMVLRLSEVKDASQQAFLVNELFGDRLGSKIIPLLNGGAEGLSKLTEEFEALGYMTNEQVEAFAEYDDQWTKIKASLTSVRNELAVSLMPIMQTIADVVEDKVVPAVRSLANWFANLTEGQKELLLGVTTFVAALAPMLIIVGKMTSGIGTLIKGVQGLQGAFTALAAHPVVAVIAAIAALMIYLYSTNEQFRESINGLAQTLGEQLQPILQTVMELFSGIFEQIKPLIDTIGNMLAPVIEMLGTALGPIVDIMGNILIRRLQVLIPVLQFVVSVMTKIAEVINKYLVPALNWLSDGFKTIIEGIPNMISQVLKFIETTVNKVINFINGLIDQINKLSKVLGFSIDKLNEITIDTSFADKLDATKSKNSSTDAGNKTTDKKASDSAINKSEYSASTINNTTVNTTNDYSNKDVVINIKVDNYAETKIDDDIVRQISIKLAAQM